MSALLADTHAVVWYLFEPAQLSAPAAAALSGAVQSGAVIYVSAVSVIEVRRILAATALAHHLPLVTADRKIQAAPIQTIW